MRIAHERFQFVHWFASTTGDWPISEMGGDYKQIVLFPLGRSDRMYVLLTPGYWHGQELSCVFCYQRKSGKNKIVYRVNLENQDRIAVKGRPLKISTPFSNLLAYFTSESLILVNSVAHIQSYVVKSSRFAKNDLAIKRDYVGYTCELVTDTLQVSLLSHFRSDGFDLEAWYDLGTDNSTQIEGTQQFYKKYGLPVAQKELELFSK